jgi:hypothetical protein
MTIPYSAAELGNRVAVVNRIGTHTEFTPDGTAVDCLMRKPSNQNGGKGGNRTLDRGIMSALIGTQVADSKQFGQSAVAAKCLKVHRSAGEIPANFPRVNADGGRPGAIGFSLCTVRA